MLLALIFLLALAGYFVPVSFHLVAAYGRSGFRARLVLSTLGGLYRRERIWPSCPGEAGRTPDQPEVENGLARQLTEALDALVMVRSRFDRYGFGGMLASFFIAEKRLPWLDVVGALERRGRFRRFNWGTEIGLEEASATAWAAGLAWGLKAGVMSFLDRRYGIPARIVSLRVKPSFNQPLLQTMVDCIFTLRAGQIIRASLKGFIMHRLRRHLSHDRRSPHRRLDENGDAEHQRDGRCQHDPR